MAQKKSEYSKDSLWGKYIARNFVHAFGPLYYMVANKKGNERARTFTADPQSDLAIAVWNMGEKGMLKHLLPIIFPKIKYRKKIYIPRYFN
jgi:hypothetical protein